MKSLVTALLMVAIVFTSTVELVLHRHEARKLFTNLQKLRADRKDLDHEWGQLLLEQATWGAHNRIEEAARGDLTMSIPRLANIRKLR